MFSFKVVDARIDARPGNSNLGLPASSFDTSFDNDKPASSSINQASGIRKGLEILRYTSFCSDLSLSKAKE
jgi:hypothetical protein